jgi:predicted GNAT family acetyltransferase
MRPRTLKTMKELTHEPDAARYVLRIDGSIVAVADYAINGNQISFNHTFTNPQFRNRGYAAEIVQFAVDDVDLNSTYRVVPMCWYVAEWFEAHRDRQGLLSRTVA